ncbi:universal stress protein [Mesobaculum littorinae]|uniref:Universal stress protein n=1 Tax=Mesobaculum littorinae TaxID=2486419 RepID=A0A438ADB4_9RHOB|nr:universal stress protein [Mesobaculum littorinae]RVV96693.1 universal stress protein [Mesobaculum littorinae]
MAVKSILTVVKDLKADAPSLDAACTMAEAEGAHLTVLCLGLDRTHPGLYYAGASAVAMQASIDEARADAAAIDAGVRKTLGASGVSWDTVPAVAQLETMTQRVAEAARFADLVVLTRPYGPGRSSEDPVVVEAALFAGGAPVLVVPPGCTPPAAPRIVVAGWNDSPEALHAIRAALPILVAADRVSVTLVDPPAHTADRSDPGGSLSQMLARHGARPDIAVLSKSMPKVSDVILRHAQDLGAELIVMGAYSHSRLREAILGGATRAMLEKSDVPLLLCR